MRSVSGTHFFMEEKQVHKCNNCGTEFEGNFCYECGQKWTDDIVCPQCGIRLTGAEKYCSECGQSIDEQASSTASGSSTISGGGGIREIICSILRYVPMALALLFAVLLPLLYTAPIAEEVGLFGHSFVGNVYSLADDFYGVCAAFLVFMFLAYLLAAVVLYLYINKNMRQKYISVFGKLQISLWEVAALSAVILIYLPCLIISASAMAKEVAGINELLGGKIVVTISCGAAPKAVLSFAVIFTVFAIGAFVVRIFIDKASETARTGELHETQVQLSVKDMKKQSREIYNSDTQVQSCKKPLLYYAYLNTRLRRAVFTFYLCTLILMILSIISVYNNAMLIHIHWSLVIGVVITIVATVISAFVKVSYWSPEIFIKAVQKKKRHNKCKLGIKKSLFILVPMLYCFIGIIYYFVIAKQRVVERLFIVVPIYQFFALAIYVVAKVIIAKQSGRIAEHLYGYPAPHPSEPLKVKYDEKRELELYYEYKVAKCRDAVIVEESEKKKSFLHKAALLSACITLVVISVICALTNSLYIDKFSTQFVSQCVSPDIDDGMMDDRMYDYEIFFGEPNDVEIIDENKSIIIYYDDEYAEAKKQFEKAEAAGDAIRMQALLNKYSDFKFNSLIIYKGEYITYCGRSQSFFKIALNAKTTVNGVSAKKTAKSVYLWSAKYSTEGYLADANEYFITEIFYTDGSYKYELVPIARFSAIDFTKKGKQTVTWSDEWGSYSATVKSK